MTGRKQTRLSLLLLLSTLLVGSTLHVEEDDEARASFLQEVQSKKGCPAWNPLKFWLKNEYRVSMVMSARLLDKVMQQEAPLVLDAMGYGDNLKLGEDSHLRVKEEDGELMVSITGVGLEMYGFSVLNDLTLYAMIKEEPEFLNITDVNIGAPTEKPEEEAPKVEEDGGDLPEEQQKVATGIFGRFRQGWSYVGKKVSQAGAAIANGAAAVGNAITGGFQAAWDALEAQALKKAGLKKFSRNTCVEFKSGATFNVYLSDIMVSDTGDVGVGFTFKEQYCEAANKDYKHQPPLFLDEATEYLMMQYVTKDLEAAGLAQMLQGDAWLPPSERARFAIAFEDGFVEKITGDTMLGVGVDNAMRIAGAAGIVDGLIASTPIAQDAFTSALNAATKYLEIAEDPDLENIAGHCYRGAMGGWFSDASYCVIDITNGGKSLFDSVFSEKEREMMMTQTEAEDGVETPTQPSMAHPTVGECPA